MKEKLLPSDENASFQERALDYLKNAEVPEGATAVLLVNSGNKPILRFGRGAGAQTSSVGELCFNTSMSGYQEILTDPSYAEQIINFTFPHIGNVGYNAQDTEARKVFAVGAVMRNHITEDANFRSGGGLEEFLVQQDLPAICGIDTRYLTHEIRDNGAPTAVLQHDAKGRFDLPALWAKAQAWGSLEGKDLAAKVSCDKPYEWTQGLWQLSDVAKKPEEKYRIVAIDYGIKQNILRHLVDCGCHVTVVPADYPADKILAYEADGIFLSNGPGDPAATGQYAVPILRELMQSGLPIFGICLGHQLLALALGATTEKMPIGHRGANHPVKDLINGTVEITSQNHGFQMCLKDLPDNLRITHRSLFDDSAEGLEVIGKPIFSVQYHPEASPGPHDSHYLFQKFIENMENRKKDEYFIFVKRDRSSAANSQYALHEPASNNEDGDHTAISTHDDSHQRY